MSLPSEATATRQGHPRDYAALVAGELVVREARADDARAIAEVSVASRRWSYRDLLSEADLEAPSVEETAADFAEGLAELPPGAAVFVSEMAGRVVGYAYVLPSPDVDVPAETSELGSIYVTEEVAGTGVARALMDAAIERARAAVASTRSTACGWMVPNAPVRTKSCRSRFTRFATECRSLNRADPSGGSDPLFVSWHPSIDPRSRPGRCCSPGRDVASARSRYTHQASPEEGSSAPPFLRSRGER